MVTLAEYLCAEAARPFGHGTADCVCLVADWVLLQRGVDPLAPWRGYASGAEAEAHIRHYGGSGGLARAVTRAIDQVGLTRIDDPRPGDVGFVALDNMRRSCAIRGTKGWLVRLREGLALYPPEAVRLLRAWRV